MVMIHTHFAVVYEGRVGGGGLHLYGVFTPRGVWLGDIESVGLHSALDRTGGFLLRYFADGLEFEVRAASDLLPRGVYSLIPVVRPPGSCEQLWEDSVPVF